MSISSKTNHSAAHPEGNWSVGVAIDKSQRWKIRSKIFPKFIISRHVLYTQQQTRCSQTTPSSSTPRILITTSSWTTVYQRVFWTQIIGCCLLYSRFVSLSFSLGNQGGTSKYRQSDSKVNFMVLVWASSFLLLDTGFFKSWKNHYVLTTTCRL